MCNRCEGIGFLHVENLPEDINVLNEEELLDWLEENGGNGVYICDCCGNGKGGWKSVKGAHTEEEIMDIGMPRCQ